MATAADHTPKGIWEQITHPEAGRLTEEGTQIRMRIWNIAETMTPGEIMTPEFEKLIEKAENDDEQSTEQHTRQELIQWILTGQRGQIKTAQISRQQKEHIRNKSNEDTRREKCTVCRKHGHIHTNCDTRKSNKAMQIARRKIRKERNKVIIRKRNDTV